MTDNHEDFADPTTVIGPAALHAWATCEVGFEAAGVQARLQQRINEGWFSSLPPPVATLMTNWGFDWSDAPSHDEVDETDRMNLALLATTQFVAGT